jgi:uncharacterized membrane protein YcaP (DUF421 family)
MAHGLFHVVLGRRLHGKASVGRLYFPRLVLRLVIGDQAKQLHLLTLQTLSIPDPVLSFGCMIVGFVWLGYYMYKNRKEWKKAHPPAPTA